MILHRLEHSPPGVGLQRGNNLARLQGKPDDDKYLVRVPDRDLFEIGYGPSVGAVGLLQPYRAPAGGHGLDGLDPRPGRDPHGRLSTPIAVLHHKDSGLLFFLQPLEPHLEKIQA